MICKCGCETGDHPHLDERECWAEMCRRVEALELKVAAHAWADEQKWYTENERLAAELAEARALIARLERTTLVGGGGSQVEIVEGRSHGWVSDGI